MKGMKQDEKIMHGGVAGLRNIFSVVSTISAPSFIQRNAACQL